ncbi:MAG TPA: hypothetical protein VE077_12485 [Candidatus Methylomirabilis sp.]|nr:hypothetical protein [Candidatus Methylomirabilis sp.]
MVTKTTRITVETETLLVVRRAKAALAWCPDCRAEVDVITLDDSRLTDPAAAQLRQWLEAGKLHLWQPAIGPAQICVTSLLQCVDFDNPGGFSRSRENLLDPSRRKQL